MPREESEKKTLFPSKEARYNCWEARDKYWECLDANGSPGSCDALRKVYEDSCPSQWVKHFDRKKKYLEFKEKIQDGYEPISDANKQS